MTPDEQTSAIDHLRQDLATIAATIAEVKGTLNDGLKLMVYDHKVQLATVKEELSAAASQIASHIAKEDVIFEIFRKTLSVGVTVTVGLVAVLLSISRGVADPMSLFVADPMSLFVADPFVSHSGYLLTWKIDCEVLTDDDWRCLTQVYAALPFPPFGHLTGPPRRHPLRPRAAPARYPGRAPDPDRRRRSHHRTAHVPRPQRASPAELARASSPSTARANRCRRTSSPSSLQHLGDRALMAWWNILFGDRRPGQGHQRGVSLPRPPGKADRRRQRGE